MLYNNPGTDYIKHNASATTIEFSQDDNFHITYTKSKDKSAVCEIQQPNKQNQLFTKLGSSQVPQVKDTTHIDKDLDYNFWSQMDKPFLIGLTPREQFDILQNSPHTATLNNCLQHITQDRKSQQTTETQLQAQLQIVQQQNQMFTTQLQKEPQISSLYTQINALQETNNTISNLKTLLQNYNKIDTQSTQNQLQKLQSIPQTTKLQEDFNKYQQVYNLFLQLQQTVNPINEQHNLLQQTTNQIERTKLFLQDNFKVCPLCNKPFGDDNLCTQ